MYISRNLLGNRWICDCRLLWLRDSYVNGSITDGGRPLYCNEPKRFRGVKIVDLSAEDLIRWPEEEGCPPGCSCSCVDENEEFSVKVDCSSRNLSEVCGLILFLSICNRMISITDTRRFLCQVGRTRFNLSIHMLRAKSTLQIGLLTGNVFSRFLLFKFAL